MPQSEDHSVDEPRRAFDRAGQGHVFRWWETLDEDARAELARDASGIELEQLRSLAALLRERSGTFVPADVAPPPLVEAAALEADEHRRRRAKVIGEELIRRGEVGLVMVAGGQSTRLGLDAPKGTLAISPIAGKSIFQLHAERIVALGRRLDRALPWFIMTSPATDADTRRFFDEHDYWGLDRADIVFFVQGTMPAVDAQGKILLSTADRIALSPDGHGGVFAALGRHGVVDEMARRGVRHLFYFQVDNVLARIAEPVFMGLHAQANAEMSLKVVRKRDPMEKVGVVVRSADRLRIVEYSDLPEEVAGAREPDGSLRFRAGSIALHAFSLPFVRRMCEEPDVLPFHVAHKRVRFVDERGDLIDPSEPNASPPTPSASSPGPDAASPGEQWDAMLERLRSSHGTLVEVLERYGRVRDENGGGLIVRFTGLDRAERKLVEDRRHRAACAGMLERLAGHPLEVHWELPAEEPSAPSVPAPTAGKSKRTPASSSDGLTKEVADLFGGAIEDLP